MSKGNQKHKSKKTHAEAKNYKSNLGENEGGLSGTSYERSVFLNGSDEINSKSNKQTLKSDEKVAGVPIHLAVKDWVKDNGISILIGMIAIPLLGWLSVTAIELTKEMAVCEYRLDDLEKDISEVSDNAPNKEVLELQLDNLRESIEKWDFSDINDRIEQLEKEVESMKDSTY